MTPLPDEPNPLLNITGMKYWLGKQATDGPWFVMCPACDGVGTKSIRRDRIEQIFDSMEECARHLEKITKELESEIPFVCHPVDTTSLCLTEFVVFVCARCDGKGTVFL